MDKDLVNKETLRVAIMAGILAIFFGIKQTITEKVFDTINFNFSLKFLSEIFFQLLLWMYLVYFLVLALNYGYKNRIKPKWVEFLFDFIITSTIIIIFLTLSLIGTILLVIKYPEYIKAGWKTNSLLFSSIILSSIFFMYNMSPYYHKVKKEELLSRNMEKNGNGIGFWGWFIVVISIILTTILLVRGKYDFALRFVIATITILALIYSTRIRVTKEDLNRMEKIEALCKLRLERYQSISINLASLGAGILLAGLALDDKLNFTAWIGLIMIIIGILVETLHVETRYALLEKHYSKMKINMR